MPSLNISFNDEEHAQLIEAARKTNTSLKAFVHAAAVDRSSDYRHRVDELVSQIAGWSKELNERLE